MSRVLYQKQRKILDFLVKFIEREGFAPTIREIAQGVGNNSPATIDEHLKALENKGVINRIRGKKRAIIVNPAYHKSQQGIPIIGQISAGQPIEAIEDNHDSVEYSFAGDTDSVFALKVSGNSMIEDGIFDGDTIIIRRQPSCNDGEVVVALLEDGNATLKRLYHEKNQIRLQPANSDYQPLYVDKLQIQGVVIGLVRKF